MQLHVLMTTALSSIAMALQLPFVGRFFEGQLKAPLRWDLRTITQHREKKEPNSRPGSWVGEPHGPA
jgi:hypothetical protein